MPKKMVYLWKIVRIKTLPFVNTFQPFKAKTAKTDDLPTLLTSSSSLGKCIGHLDSEISTWIMLHRALASLSTKESHEQTRGGI